MYNTVSTYSTTLQSHGMTTYKYSTLLRPYQSILSPQMSYFHLYSRVEIALQNSSIHSTPKMHDYRRNWYHSQALRHPNILLLSIFLWNRYSRCFRTFFPGIKIRLHMRIGAIESQSPSHHSRKWSTWSLRTGSGTPSSFSSPSTQSTRPRAWRRSGIWRRWRGSFPASAESFDRQKRRCRLVAAMRSWAARMSRIRVA